MLCFTIKIKDLSILINKLNTFSAESLADQDNVEDVNDDII